jgi:hypothetical protein
MSSLNSIFGELTKRITRIAKQVLVVALVESRLKLVKVCVHALGADLKRASHVRV